VDCADLVQKLIGDAHPLDAVVRRVVVGAVKEVEANVLEVEHHLRRTDLPVAAVLDFGPALEFLHAENGLLEVDHRGIRLADDVDHGLEARIVVILVNRDAAVDNGVAGGSERPYVARSRNDFTGGGLSEQRSRDGGGETGEREPGAPHSSGRREMIHGVTTDGNGANG
jgi:hypothetical protein